MIIAISGHNKIGKSTLAQWLKEEYTALGKTVEIYSFASTLRNELYRNFDKEWLEQKSDEARRLFRAWGDARRAENSMYFVTPIINKLEITSKLENHVSIIDDVYHINEFSYLNMLFDAKNIFIQKTFHKIKDEDYAFESVRQTEVILGFYKHRDIHILLDADKNIKYDNEKLNKFTKNTKNIYLIEHIFDNYPEIKIFMQKTASRFIQYQGE